MYAPSLTLNSLVHYDVVLKLFNITPKEDRLPSFQCPVCNKGLMRIYGDPEGGYWVYCNSCRFAGSIIQLYQHLRKISDFRPAWFQLIIDAKLNVPVHFTTPKALDEHTAYGAGREHALKFWKQSQDLIKTDTPTWTLNLLRYLGLWGTYNPRTFNDKLGQFMGGMSYHFIDLLTLATSIKYTRKLAKSLVLAYEVLPGRPCMFLFIRKDQRVAKYIDNYDCAAKQLRKIKGKYDSGLLGLSTITNTIGTVYAVFDPILFLQLQKRQLRDSNKPFPLVCSVPRITDVFTACDTTEAWAAVHNDKVVFWDYEDSIDVINQARILGDRGYIATEPVIAKPDYSIGVPESIVDKSITMPQLRKRLEDSAIHWTVYLRNKLIDYAPTDGLDLLSQLKSPLVVEEWNRILEGCSDEDKARINKLTKPEISVKTFIYNGQTFIERPGHGWFRINKITVHTDPLELLITDAYPIIKEASMVDTKAYISGDISYKGNLIPFCVEESKLRTDPAGTIIEYCISHECGLPRMHREYRPELYDMALTINRPKITKVMNKVGWDNKTKQYIFPRFTLKDGVISPQPEIGGNYILPAYHLLAQENLPPLETIKRWFIPGSTNELGFAFISTIIGSLVAPVMGMQHTGTVVIDAYEKGREAIYKIAQQLGMMSYRVGYVRPSTLDEMHKAEIRHDIPIMLHTEKLRGPEWENWFRYTSPRNLVISTTSDVAFSLGLVGDWTYIKCPSAPPVDLDNLEQMECLISLVLLHLQRNDYNFDRTIPYHKAMLRAVFDYLDKQNLGIDVAPMRDKAEQKLIYTDRPLWERFLWCVFQGVENQTIRIDTTGKYNKRITVSYDKEKKAYNLYWDALGLNLSNHGVFIPLVETLDKSFTDANVGITDDQYGWSIPESTWDTYYASWEAIFRN